MMASATGSGAWARLGSTGMSTLPVGSIGLSSDGRGRFLRGRGGGGGEGESGRGTPGTSLLEQGR